MQNIIIFGSDNYSAIVLKHLLESSNKENLYSVLAVVTDRPKPVEKDHSLASNPVDKLANTHNLKIFYYPTNHNEMINFVDDLKNEQKGKNIYGLCASFDHLVPFEIIEIFNGNLYNLHPSLLPQYRNVSPVQYAIALGDKLTGITLFRISVGIDNGEIIAQAEESITDSDTTMSLTPRLFTKGSELFISFLTTSIIQQPARSDLAGVPLVFTKRLTRDSGYVEWEIIQKLLNNKPVDPSDSSNLLLQLALSKSKSASPIIIQNLIRALSPWPTVWTNIPTKKGILRVTIESVIPDIKFKIAGKPSSISSSDFTKYYL